MNLDIFEAIAKRAYDENPCDYSLEEVLQVFEYYFQVYENTFNKSHPHISLKQIKRIILEMPYVKDD